MLRLLIIADDFTGALDTGVQFAACGVSTRVVVGEEAELTGCESAVLVMDTETRHLPAAAAGAAIEALTRRAVEAGVPCIYKPTQLCAETLVQSFPPCSKQVVPANSPFCRLFRRSDALQRAASITSAVCR